MERRAFDKPNPASPLARQLGLWLRDVVDFCYPDLCLHCKTICDDGSSLCSACGQALDQLAQKPACGKCGMTLAYAGAACPACSGRGVPHFTTVTRLAPFEAPIRELVHQLKYHRQWMVGRWLADRMLKEDRVEARLLEADCLMAVPLHFWREFSRGFNQSEVIAQQLSLRTGLPVISPVSRIVHTETQTHLHLRRHRMKNLRNAFCLNDADAVAGRRIVVIDDVMTTGATLQTLGRALRPAKPRRLDAMVLAVAQSRALTNPARTR